MRQRIIGRLPLAAWLAAGLVACGGTAAGPAARSLPSTADTRLPSPASCVRPGADFDADGLSDECEAALAFAFAPVLMQDRQDCVWRDDAAATRIPGGYYHAVQPFGEGRVRLGYLPAYLRDCGWSGAKCLLPGVDCRAHAGDSEAIIIEAAYDDRQAAWRANAVFLSAHCFDGAANSCRWYEGPDLQAFAWHGLAPVVWVASGRHANYRSRSECQRGHYRLDVCVGNAVPVVFPVMRDRNVGSEQARIGDDGCVVAPPDLPSALVVAGAIECFWSERPFRGWQESTHPGVTPYRRYLAVMEAQ